MQYLILMIFNTDLFRFTKSVRCSIMHACELLDIEIDEQIFACYSVNEIHDTRKLPHTIRGR